MQCLCLEICCIGFDLEALFCCVPVWAVPLLNFLFCSSSPWEACTADAAL
jgi:hypothetical protein